jgi:hypothetical protein
VRMAGPGCLTDGCCLWRVRVLQGPAARHGTIKSVLSVVQVRMAT